MKPHCIFQKRIKYPQIAYLKLFRSLTSQLTNQAQSSVTSRIPSPPATPSCPRQRSRHTGQHTAGWPDAPQRFCSRHVCSQSRTPGLHVVCSRALCCAGSCVSELHKLSLTHVVPSFCGRTGVPGGRSPSSSAKSGADPTDLARELQGDRESRHLVWSGLPSSTPAQSQDGESHRCAHLAAQLRWRSSPGLRYGVICLVPAPISCRHQHLLPAWVCDAGAAPALTARFSYSFAPDKPLLSTPTDLSAFSFQ